MIHSGWLKKFVCSTLVGLLGLSVGAWGETASAFSPESPEVRAMVEKALGPISRSTDIRLGAKCLRALCFLKYYKLVKKDAEAKTAQPIIDAVNACAGAKVESDVADVIGGVSNYSLGIALMYLCEHDPVGNRQLIERYVAELLRRQKSHGGWGYAGEPTGDTSQTQYAVLGMWMAQKVAKIQIPIEAQESCAGWLMRTQDPSGGWGYQGVDPGVMTRVEQSRTTQSLSAAGCGSLYILADLLQVTDSASQQKERPGPFKQIEDVAKSGPAKKGPLTRKLEPAMINSYLALGDSWFRNNYKFVPDASHLHYSMYARERYESFKDLAAGEWTKEPQWYNDGVRLLQKSQQKDGSWQGQDTSDIATSFAVLFLLRSTQRILDTITDLGSGEQRGGISFPEDVANIQEDGDGRIVDKNFQGSIDQVLAILAKGDSPEVLNIVASSKSLKLDGDVTRRESQIEQLRKVVSAGEPDFRLAAVRLIGKARGLANVPTLLFALTDPHTPVVIEADLALRFVSRKTEGVGLPSEPTGDDIKAAQAAWKAWYLSVKPDAELLD